jgi:hypothetical protein
MSTETEPGRPWSDVFRRATATTARAAPWVWIAVMIPVVVEGAWRLRTIGRVTLLAVAALPLVFLVSVAVQRLPRSWYRAH